MREIFIMWKYRKMVALMAFTAGIYAAVLIPLGHISIFPGFSEFNPSHGLPIVFGLFFGPAGAWGVAIGSMIEELIAGFTVYSIFNIVGSFILAYIPYKLWNKLYFQKGYDIIFNRKEAGNIIINLILVALVSSLGAAFVMAWGSSSLAKIEYFRLAILYALNNSLMTIILGSLLFLVLLSSFKRWDLLWISVMKQEDIFERSKLAALGGWLMLGFVLLGFFGCLLASFFNHEYLINVIGCIALAGMLTGAIMEY